jgi:hypothetical protein
LAGLAAATSPFVPDVAGALDAVATAAGGGELAAVALVSPVELAACVVPASVVSAAETVEFPASVVEPAGGVFGATVEVTSCPADATPDAALLAVSLAAATACFAEPLAEAADCATFSATEAAVEEAAALASFVVELTVEIAEAAAELVCCVVEEMVELALSIVAAPVCWAGPAAEVTDCPTFSAAELVLGAEVTARAAEAPVSAATAFELLVEDRARASPVAVVPESTAGEGTVPGKSAGRAEPVDSHKAATSARPTKVFGRRAADMVRVALN